MRPQVRSNLIRYNLNPSHAIWPKFDHMTARLPLVRRDPPLIGLARKRLCASLYSRRTRKGHS